MAAEQIAKDKDKDLAKLVSKIPLSEIEQVAYWRIKEAAGEDKIVMCQVAFSSFLKAERNSKEGFAKFATARQKVADFVICNKDFSIFAIIEIDDSTHNTDKDSRRDAITGEAGIKTYRYQARKLPSVDEMKKEILI
ncbi:MAG TPA: DUF2726 domain-containing protein [Methylotenera sp.]|nr:DUF2726 domain-containing protein [Methylotenera sp.]